uniref:RING-type domain-containing protein n=1 Tax=Panagrellus redivivus TaxID=6233 RepID=A0A7E4VDT5_PANRE
MANDDVGGEPPLQPEQPLLFHDEVSRLRAYNKMNNITVDQMHWNDPSALIPYGRIVGPKYQPHHIKRMVKLSFIKDEEWEVVKRYMTAFEDDDVSMRPEASTRSGYRDVNAKLWKLFNVCYEKDPTHTVAAFEKVNGRYRTYEELNEYLNSKFLGRLRLFGIDFSSIKEACDVMLDGRIFTDQQLYKALRSRMKMQRVGIRKTCTTKENVETKLRWFLDEYCNVVKWSGHHVNDFNILGELKMAEFAIMDTQWLAEYVDMKSFFKTAEGCQVEVLMMHEGSTSQSFCDFKANKLLSEPTFAVKLLLQPRDELIFNYVMFNTVDIWVYVRDGEEVYTWKELRSAVNGIQISSMMEPAEFGQVMLNIISSLFDEDGPSSTLMIPPTIALPEFGEIMKKCALPAEYVYINEEHKMRVEEIRTSITLQPKV